MKILKYIAFGFWILVAIVIYIVCAIWDGIKRLFGRI